MSNDNVKLEKLHCTFPKLTEENQHYVLGLAEGLKRAQNNASGKQPPVVKTEVSSRKTGMV